MIFGIERAIPTLGTKPNPPTFLKQRYRLVGHESNIGVTISSIYIGLGVGFSFLLYSGMSLMEIVWEGVRPDGDDTTIISNQPLA